MQSTRTVALIQARTGSSRLPNKVLLPLAGRPMLERMIERVKEARTLESVVIATSDQANDDAIETLARDVGTDVFRGSQHDVLDRMYRAALSARAATVVRLTGDCPLIDPMVIDEVVEKFRQGGVDYCSTPRNYPEGLDTEVFSFAALERAWREAVLPSEREHVTPYIKNHPEFFRMLAWEKGPDDNSSMHWSVDSEADLEFVSAIYARLMSGGTFHKDDILALLRDEPALLDINRGGTGYEGYERSVQEDEEFRKRHD